MERYADGGPMERTPIIRRLVVGLMGSGLDLSTLGTEEASADANKERLGKEV